MQSEMDLKSDVLQPLPLDEWPLLQKLLKIDWPRHANYYYWIENSIKWKKQDPNLALQIYCPQGKYQDDATFVGISSFATYSVYIFTKDPSGNRLYDALIKTNRFDWSEEVIFSGVHEYIAPILLSALALLRSSRGIEINTILPHNCWIKPANECANLEIEVPEECYLGDLNPSHLSTIHSFWPHSSKEQPEISMKHLRALITLNTGIGLFLKKGDVLVSWTLHNEWHGLGVSQTLESYKRRGYSKIVINALAKRLGKEGISPISAVGTSNAISQNLSVSLNWTCIVSCVWIIMKKQLPSHKTISKY